MSVLNSAGKIVFDAQKALLDKANTQKPELPPKQISDALAKLPGTGMKIELPFNGRFSSNANIPNIDNAIPPSSTMNVDGAGTSNTGTESPTIPNKEEPVSVKDETTANGTVIAGEFKEKISAKENQIGRAHV